MRFLVAILLTSCSSFFAMGTPLETPHVPAGYKKGFMNPIVFDSIGGRATCIQGDVAVTATTTKNVKLDFALPSNQTVVTESFVLMNQVNTTFPDDVIGPFTTVSGNFTINSKLCYPKKGGLNSTAVQFLTHGGGFDKTYWSFASEEYSYVDAAAKAGYTTFSYDRLGVGMSSLPKDSIQVVQLPIQVTIANELITSLRTGRLASTSFDHVIGVGHSLGSVITQGVTNTYSNALDAAVLTGFSLATGGQVPFMTGLELQIASIVEPKKFKGLNNGYLLATDISSNQLGFFRVPGFPYSNLQLAEATKQTFTFGEILRIRPIVQPADNFTGPVAVVDGANDLPFCQGNCKAVFADIEAVSSTLYPMAANFSIFLAPDAGHGINAHYSAPQAYSYIMSFLNSNGF